MYEQLPDTPWHIGFAKKEEDDPRRHRARCIHYYDGKCMFGDQKCIGSSHCDFYAETQAQWEEILKNKRTAEQEQLYRIVKYKESFKNKISDYQRNFDLPLQYVKASNIRFCPVCDTKFVPSKELNVVRCKYCGAVFCNESYYVEYGKKAIIVGRKRESPKKNSASTGVYIVSNKAAGLSNPHQKKKKKKKKKKMAES